MGDMPEWPFLNEAQDLGNQQKNPFQEPIAVTAGDTITWKRNLSQFPASGGWSLKYSLRGVRGTSFDATSTANGDEHDLTITAAQSGNWQAGKYKLAGYATNGLERHTIYEGDLVVKPNLAAADQNTDFRSHAQICLNNIEAVLEKRATNDVLNSTIEGTIIGRIPVRDLLLLRDRYLAEVQGEEQEAKAKEGRATGRNIFAVFTPVGR